MSVFLPILTLLASASPDIDGDGRADRVEVSASEVRVVLAAGGQFAAPMFSPEEKAVALGGGSITSGSGKPYGGGSVVVAVGTVASARGAQAARVAVAVGWKAGTFRLLWRGAVGPQGNEGEWSVQVEATPFGLLRYQTRAGVARCDGRTAHLHAERFSVDDGKFLPASEVVGVGDDAPVLTAQREAPRGLSEKSGALVFRAGATSSQAGAQNAGELAPPREIDDGDLTTAWVEGKAGNGRGEFVTAQSALGVMEVRALRLVPGHAASRESFRQHDRVKRAALLVGKQAYWIEFRDDPARQLAQYRQSWWVELPKGVSGDCATLILADAYGNAGRTAVSEWNVYAAVEVGGAEQALAARVAAGGEGAAAAATLLAARGAAAEAALVAALGAAGLPAASAARLRRVLARIPAGAAELTAGLRAPESTAADQQAFARALVSLSGRAVAPLAELLGDEQAPMPARVRAAELLGVIGGEAASAALLAVVGRGGAELRRPVALALGARGPARTPAEADALLAAARAAEAEDEAREADLWRAAGLMARSAAPELRARVATALAARLDGARGYELSYRLVAAAGGLPEPAALAAVAGVMAARASDGDEQAQAQAVALRRVAVAALAENPSDRVIELLLVALGDPDPGVRSDSAAVLATRFAAAGPADAALAARLRDDRWPEVRRAAAAALGARCGRTALARALFDAAGGKQERDLDVRRASMTALVTCGAAGIDERLLGLARDRGEIYGVRTHAVRMIGKRGPAARALAPALAAEMRKFRIEASRADVAIKLAAAGAWALGKLRSKAGVAELHESAREVGAPEIRAAAVLALSEFCGPADLSLLRELTGSDEHAVKLAAGRALARCKRNR